MRQIAPATARAAALCINGKNVTRAARQNVLLGELLAITDNSCRPLRTAYPAGA